MYQNETNPFTIVWEDDWSVGNHLAFYGKGSCYETGEPRTCEQATAYDSLGKVVAYLGCIDDANDEDRSNVNGILMSDAFDALAEQWASVSAWMCLV